MAFLSGHALPTHACVVVCHNRLALINKDAQARSANGLRSN